jgi:SSS family solute:Na+ symporter
VDLGVVGAYLLAITSLGLGFAREQNTTERYFLTRRTIPAWAIAMSLLATLTTTTAFLAYLAASFATAWALLAAAILLLPAAAIIVPFYRRAVRMSVYEYFGQRFGRGVQTYAGAAYLLGHAAMMAFLLYLLARTVHTQTGWGTDRIILVAGFLTVLYTLLGGLEAVIWTNVLQGYVLLACALTALAAPRPARLIGWPSALTILYGLIWCLQKYAADQSIVQRFFAASSDRAAVKGVRIGALLCIALPALLFLPIPTTRFFRPLAHFPPGVPGLAMSALLGSAMCAFAADLNSFALVGVEDLYRPWRPDGTDRTRLSLAKTLVFLCGAGCVAGALELAHANSPALSTWLNLTAAGIGGLAGIFVLAFLIPRASRRGVWAGIAASIAFTIWATLAGRSHGPLTSDPWTAAAPPLVLIAVACVASFVWPDPAGGKVTGMTLWHWRRYRNTTPLE